MGPRLLCFAGGAALTAFFVHLGLLATPFFGSGAFLWANVFACFLMATALGHGLGDLIATVFGRREAKHAAPRLAVVGGLGAWVATWALPMVCRSVLAPDPDWAFAPAMAIAVAGLLPGALIAAIAPSELRARLATLGGSSGGPGADDTRPPSSGASDDELTAWTGQVAGTGARGALRLLGLMTLGGIAGVALSAKSVLRADQVDVWLHAYLVCAALAGLGLCFLSNLGRGLGGVAILALAGAAKLDPSEIQSAPFAVALETAWKQGQGAGLYYRRTAAGETLSEADLQAQATRLARSGGGEERPGVVLACEMLLSLGEVTVTGDGLSRTLKLVLSAETRPFLMPFFENLESVRSDGKGLLTVRIKRQRGEEGRRFSIPGEAPDKRVEFWFKDDFTVHISHVGPTWKLEFGPLETIRAGVFEHNDTLRTPLRVLNVALWLDASVLGITIDDHPDQVVVKALAQGDVGAVRTIDLSATPKVAQSPGRPGR